ncbi:MAG TPA: hypothetical protein DIC34_18860 [Treponema sp.]|nr:hypothetical protein [Treponema sp.]
MSGLPTTAAPWFLEIALQLMTAIFHLSIDGSYRRSLSEYSLAINSLYCPGCTIWTSMWSAGRHGFEAEHRVMVLTMQQGQQHRSSIIRSASSL